MDRLKASLALSSLDLSVPSVKLVFFKYPVLSINTPRIIKMRFAIIALPVFAAVAAAQNTQVYLQWIASFMRCCQAFSKQDQLTPN
jgi:hypothetical protein